MAQQQENILELEDLECDVEENEILEINAVESLRRLEMSRGIQHAEIDKQQSIRKQKNLWKVKTTRTTKILENRHDINTITAALEIKTRNLYLGSISYQVNLLYIRKKQQQNV